MKAKEKIWHEKAIEAGEAVMQAGQELLDYLEQVDQILDMKQDRMRMQDVIFIKARCYALRAKWKVKAFDYLAMTDHTPEEIARLLSDKKKSDTVKIASSC